jgi:SNF2 family DNA or RNA helicase
LKQLDVERKLLMTGTPIQNNTPELWTLLNYLDAPSFPDLEEFKKQSAHLCFCFCFPLF